MFVEVVAAAGLLVSLYAWYVERRFGEKSYKPACDISENVSCTKAFTSRYGRLFGIPNSVLGVVFYTAMFVLAWFGYAQLVLYAAIFAMLGTLYLAYISYFVQKNFCLVCWSVYVVNIVLLLAAGGII